METCAGQSPAQRSIVLTDRLGPEYVAAARFVAEFVGVAFFVPEFVGVAYFVPEFVGVTRFVTEQISAARLVVTCGVGIVCHLTSFGDASSGLKH